MIANLCKKYDCIAVMDEVYEWIFYKGNEHFRMSRDFFIYVQIESI
jgi:aspartate/methionine/tyrosine aminotransferase